MTRSSTPQDLGESSMRRLSDLGLLLPTALLALAAMAVFVLSLVFWSWGVDESTRLREQELVRQGLASAVAEVEASIVPETVWDEAVLHLDHRADLAWADANLNDFYALGFDFSRLLVIDGGDRPIYHRRNLDQVNPSEAPVKVFSALISEVRAAEARRGPWRPVPDGYPDPIQASGFVAIDGRIRLATASLFQPDQGSILPQGERAPILLTLLPIEQVSIEVLQDRYLLGDLRTGLGAASADPDDAQLSIDVLDADAPLVLAWTPQKPGTALLRRSVLPVLAVLLAFGAVAAVMVTRARHSWRQQMAAQRTQAEFLANMSHEIRTPLNGVVAVASALERTTLTPMQREMVQIIRTSGLSLERLLSDLLDVSRMEAGMVEITSEPFHLGDAVRMLKTLLGPRATEKGLALVLEIDPRAETQVLGDPLRLKQALANLVVNALKFTEAGQVRLRVSPLDDIRWRFTIEDSGMGFDPSQKADLFRRFAQADATISRRFGGMGLGLAISRQLVGLMGGEIDAASAGPGRGAVFWIDLPLPPTEVQAEQTEDIQTTERPLRILVADDHPINRQVVEVLLSEFDVELVLAENGLEAYEAFEAAPFDMVLMDMQMPVMDGLTAIRKIRARETDAAQGRTPIVMLTANTLPEHRAASLEAGADLHLPKPIEAERLIAVLQSVVEGQNTNAA